MDLDKNLIPLRLEIAGMSNRLFELIGMRPDQVDEKQRQKLAAYAFGMNFAMGMQNQLGPPQVHALAISYLMDTFRYTDRQAAQFSELLIQATRKPSPQPALNAICHRGIDGHAMLKAKKIDQLRDDLYDLLGLAKPAAPSPPAPLPQKGRGEKNPMRAAREKVYKQFFGTEFKIDRQTTPEQPPIDVYVFEPGHNDRDFFTLVTSGLSDQPMNVPEGGPSARAEIILYVDEPKDHYLHVLHWLARIPHDSGGWYGPGTTMNNGNPPQPIFEGSRLDSFLFISSIVKPDYELEQHLVLGGDPVHFLWMVPITSDECLFIIKNQPGAFLNLLDENEHPFVLDERRKSYIRSKRG